MDIFTTFSALGVEEGCRDLEELFQAINSAFNDEARDKETYLYENWEENRFCFGNEVPELVKNRAEAWNREIKAQFMTALDRVTRFAERGRMPEADELPMDTADTYLLRAAAAELDNSWFDTAEHGVYFENDCGYPYFKVQLQDAAIADIQTHPEKYLIITVSPKV